jgi:hypothetical protein
MHCPYLCHRVDECHAVEPSYRPSEFQLDEYCATEMHQRCPYFRKQALLSLAPATIPLHAV